MKIAVLYEDDNYLVINKPAGLVVHSDGRTKEKTLVDWIIKKYPEIEKVGEPTELSNGEIIDRPGIVHRLDRDTSGAMVIAKTPRAFSLLKKQFRDREIKKTYHTVVDGILKEEDGIIDRPIGRSPRDFRKYISGRGAKGELREAITRWSVLARGTISGLEKGQKEHEVTLVEAIPKTGRTHQIRVHFKSIHHPIIGDDLYGPKTNGDSPDKLAKSSPISRVALHSYSINFVGLDGKKISAIAPYPEDFASLVEKVREGKV